MAEAALKQETISNQPDDEAVIAVNLSKVRKAIDTVKNQGEYLREVIDHAKGKGINVKAAKRAFAIIESGEAKAWLTETQDITRYLRILRHGVTESQLKLEFTSTLEPIDEKAGLDGRAHGLDGGDENANPHDLSTKAGQAWLAACRQGLSERNLILSMKDDEPEADED